MNRNQQWALIIGAIIVGGVGVYLILTPSAQADDQYTETSVQVELSSIQVSGDFTSLEIFNLYDQISSWDRQYEGTVLEHCITVEDNDEHSFEIKEGKINPGTFHIIFQLITAGGELFSFDFYAVSGEAYEFSYTPPDYVSGITIELTLVE